MTEHPNVERLRRGFEAYARGDLAGLRDLVADGASLHFLGHTPLSGDYNGMDAVLGYFGRLRESGAAFRFEVHDLLAGDGHAVALLTATAERAGRRIEQKVVHVFHMRVDGKVLDWWNFWEDQAALDDLFRA
jgi:uncharacterized protein